MTIPTGTTLAESALTDGQAAITPPTPLLAGRGHAAFLRLVCLAQVGLMVVTWPLWFGDSDVPRISLLPATGVPSVVDGLLSGLLLAGCVMLSCNRLTDRPHLKRFAGGLLLLAAALAVLDTARLQPWHWLFMMLLVPIVAGSGQVRSIHRVTVAGIYLFAALSRFDPAFPVDGGILSRILTTLLEMIDLGHLLRNPGTARWLTAAVSGVELAAGVCLVIPRWNRVGVLLAMTIHASLLAALGPWALGHSWGVLLWNTVLLCGVPLLFSARGAADDRRTASGVWLSGLVLLIPATALVGLADNWIGWQVYSPRTDRVWLSVAESQRARLPASLLDFVAEPQPLQEVCLVRLDRWVNAQTGAPLYPEDRYQLALVAAVTAELEDGQFQVGMSRPAGPQWWQRQETRLLTREELQRMRELFWVPSLPR